MSLASRGGCCVSGIKHALATLMTEGRGYIDDSWEGAGVEVEEFSLDFVLVSDRVDFGFFLKTSKN